MNKRKLYFIITILILFNISLLYILHNYSCSETQSEKLGKFDFDSIKFYKSKIPLKPLNVVIIWGEKGCGICKLRLARKLSYYKNNFNEYFKFIFVGNPNSDIRKYNIGKYISFVFNSEKDLFENNVDVNQPFITLTDNKGEVLFGYRMYAMDVKNFDKFNLKLESIFNLIK